MDHRHYDFTLSFLFNERQRTALLLEAAMMVGDVARQEKFQSWLLAIDEDFNEIFCIKQGYLWKIDDFIDVLNMTIYDN